MNPLKNPLALIAVVMIAALVVFAAYVITSTPGSVTSPVPSRFTVNGKTFAITDTAINNAQREEGLMNRKVTNATVMLFAFPSPGHFTFWMYGTNTSLDIIWVSVDGSLGRVVYVASSAPPCYVSASCTTYTPSAPANYVLEAKAGFAEANNIEVGASIEFG